MQNTFFINHIFNENLQIHLNFSDIFLSNQSYIFQNTNKIKNVLEITNYTETNNFEITYRTSLDGNDWTQWLSIENIITQYQNDFYLQLKIINTSVQDLTLSHFEITGKRKIDEFFQSIEILNVPVVLKNSDIYKVFKLTDYEVFLESGDIADLSIKIRYTQTQGRQWSQWFDLNNENLKQLKISKIKFCQFEFMFINSGQNLIKIYDVELIGEFTNVTAKYKTISRFGLKTQCNPLLNENADECTVNSQSETPWNSDIDNCGQCKDKKVQSLNDRNIWTGMIKLQEKMNEYVNDRNSWSVTYLLTDADGKGIDHILHEQQIHNVIEMKDIKVIVPDNQFPVDNIMFDHLNFDLIQSFEVHILITHFKDTFGVEFRPGKRDVLYFCDTNQLWEVEQVFPHRGFMNASFYHRVLLKKYSDNKSRQFANTDQGQKAKDFTDVLAKHTSLDALFFGDNTNDIKQMTKDNNQVNNPSQQYTQNTITSVRNKIHSNVNIIDNEIWNASLMISDTQYELPLKSKGLKLIEYNYLDQSISIAENRAISALFKTSKYDPTHDYTILSNYDFTLSLGYKLTMFNGVLTFTWNQNNYSIPVAQLIEDDVWYFFMINYDQQQKECEIAIYSRMSEDGIVLNSSKLKLITKNKFIIIPEQIEHTESIFIGGVDTNNIVGNRNKWYLTNIRIYNQIINNRHIVLNEKTVSDAHLTVLVDNAEKDINLPSYGNL